MLWAVNGRTLDQPLPSPVAPPAWKQWLGVLALCLLTLATSWFAFRNARFGGVAALWAANGLLTGALLLSPRRAWPAFFAAGLLGQLTARLAVGDDAMQVLVLPLANLLECAIVAYWVRRHVDDLRRARSLGLVARDALLSTLVACALSACIALPVLLSHGGDSALIAWGTWFTAHLLGMVVVATLTVCAFQQGVHLFGAPGQRLDFALCFALLLVVCGLAFGQSRYSLLFLVYLPLLMLSFRHGLSGMVLGIITVAGISGITAAEGVGSFALAHTSSPLARLLYWQLYIAGGCLLSYVIAVAMTQRRQFEARLHASQAQLKSITDHIPAMVARFDRDGRYVYANPRSRSMFPGVELLGRTLAEVRPDRAESLAPKIAAVLRGEPQEYDAQLPFGSRVVDLNVQFVPDVGADGAVQGFYSLAFDITEAKRLERELEQLARFDALTGLANRRHFEEELEAAVARASRTGSALMVVSLDLDKFKQINDTLGHAAGDEVLVEFGRRIRASVYDVDLVARLGGDEFVVLVQYTVTAENGARIAEHILAAMVPPMQLSCGPVQAGTSIGVGLAQPVTSAAALLALSDRALYDAKSRGRNTYSLLREDGSA